MAVDNDHARSEHPGKGQLRRVMCGLDSKTLRQIGRKRHGKAFWPCNMVVLLTQKTWPKHGGTRPRIVPPTPTHLVHVGI
jgi:hypothetical protein